MARQQLRLVALCGLYALVLALLLAATIEREPYDDSYFFKRVAVNALEHKALAWNVSDGPVYGSTSQLFQAVVVGLTALAHDHTILATRVFLLLCLLVSFGLLLGLTAGQDHGVAEVLAASSPLVLYTALSGMETALALALLSWLLVALYGESARRLHWSVPSLITLLLWLARPDAILLALPLLLERWSRVGRAALREIALLGGALAALLVLFKLYYGTALPLPFYAKQALTTPYDAHFIHLAHQGRHIRFGYFLANALPLCAVGLLRRDRHNLTLLAAVLLFEVFHLVSTVDVMGMHGRFYMPALPLLVLAAARAGAGPAIRPWFAVTLAIGYSATLLVLALAGWLPNFSNRAEGVPLAHYCIAAAGTLLLLTGLAYQAARPWAAALILVATACANVLAYPWTARALPSDDRYLQLHAAHVTVYRGMDTLLSCFGETIHVYHSEVGVPGLRFQHGKVTDLAGLLSPEWLFGQRGFDELCLRDRPEAIFLPHKHYAALNREIQHGECIRGYRRAVERSSSPLYIRNDLWPRYKLCR